MAETKRVARLVRALSAFAACVLSALIFIPVGAGAIGGSPYSSAHWSVTTGAYTFGQAPVFMPDGRVVFGKNFNGGAGTQVYVAKQDGSALHCLTCELQGPNNVPAVRPGGDWILFHSWMGHQITLGSPGYGGLGSALWIMRADGSGVTQLTDLTTGPAAEGYDDYHAYWSPDGNQVVWTHLNWNFVNGGGSGKWEVDVADFVATPTPHLTNIRVVRPPNGHWYETQWWAPDGSGFLYTETSGTAMDTELFFCRLTVAGCDVTQLTDYPSWNEQALFTPDGKDVIFMSSRAAPGFCNDFITLARDLNLTASEDYLLTLPIFEACFEQPVGQEATDLYLLDLSTHQVKRLTTDGDAGWVTPEFAWDPTNSFLMWTEIRFPPGYRLPIPFNPLVQLAAIVTMLETGVPLPTLNTSNLLSPGLPLQYQTRILRFDVPRVRA